MTDPDRSARSSEDLALARRLVRRMLSVLDVQQVIETGARATFRMHRFDLTVDLQLGEERDKNELAFVIWENCSQPLCALVDPKTLEISKLLGFDQSKIENEVMPVLIRATILDELSDI